MYYDQIIKLNMKTAVNSAVAQSFLFSYSRCRHEVNVSMHCPVWDGRHKAQNTNINPRQTRQITEDQQRN